MRRSIHRRWACDKRKSALGIVQFFSLSGRCFCDRHDGQTMPAKHATALRFLQWSAGCDCRCRVAVGETVAALTGVTIDLDR